MTLMDALVQYPIVTILAIAAVVFIIRLIAIRVRQADKAGEQQQAVAKPRLDPSPAPIAAAAGTLPQVIAAISAAVKEYQKTENEK